MTVASPPKPQIEKTHPMISASEQQRLYLLSLRGIDAKLSHAAYASR